MRFDRFMSARQLSRLMTSKHVGSKRAMTGDLSKLTSFLQLAKYGWYILPSALTCCPALIAISSAGVMKLMGGAHGYS